MVMNWMRGAPQLPNIMLQGLDMDLVAIVGAFHFFHITHVYREHNQRVDVILKEGGVMMPGVVSYTSLLEGEDHEGIVNLDWE